MQTFRKCLYKRNGSYAVYVFGCIAVLDIFLFIYFFPFAIITTPYGDMLDWVSRFYLNSSENLLQFLWAQCNEHRPVFPKLLVVADARIFGGYIYPVAIVNVSLLFISSLVIVAGILKSLNNPNVQWWSVAAILILLFPTSSIVNYAYPVNILFALVCCFAFLSFLFIGISAKASEMVRSKKYACFILSLFFAVCACLSSANGIVVWFILLWIAWKGKLNRFASIALLLAGGITISYYFQGYVRLSSSDISGIHLSDIFGILSYLIEFYGMPWISVRPLYWIAFLIGCIVLCLGITVIIIKTVSKNRLGGLDLFAVPMLMFAMASSILISMGRYKLGLLPAHRYGIFTVIVFVSLFVVAVQHFEHWWQDDRLRTGILWGGCLIGIGFLIQQVLVGQFAVERAEHFKRLEQEILSGNRDPEITLPIYPDVDRLNAHYRMMEKYKIYMFR